MGPRDSTSETKKDDAQPLTRRSPTAQPPTNAVARRLAGKVGRYSAGVSSCTRQIELMQ